MSGYNEQLTDMTKLVQPKSDQLNAEDLIGGSITVNIQSVQLTGNAEQPVQLSIDGGYRPYKPCKSMSRLLVFCWGKDGNEWIGRSLTLYRDPSVKWAGEEVGGIRISHLSHLDKPTSVALTITRGKRKPYLVEPLTIPNYPKAEFDKNLSAWTAAIESKKATAEQIIQKVQQKGLLSADMKSTILALENQVEDATDLDAIPDL